MPSIQNTGADPVKKYWPCDCGNDDLSRAVISGEGDWARTILCEECVEVQDGVPPNVLVSLLEEKHGWPEWLAREFIGLDGGLPGDPGREADPIDSPHQGSADPDLDAERLLSS